MLKRLLKYILNGLLITLPLFLTGYVIWSLFTFLDGLIPKLIYSKRELQAFEEQGKTIWGWGILILLVVLIVIGWIGTRFINQRLQSMFQRALNRVPLIKTIYRSVTELLGAFVGSKKRFNQPVIVRLSNDPEILVLGFVTDADLENLGDMSGKVGVYIPMSYSFSGHLVIVSVRQITRVEQNAVDVMKYIMSGGIVEIDDHTDKQG
ncbi:MAG: DUF502 domain-containing protein [Flavobacteriales bacterium]